VVFATWSFCREQPLDGDALRAVIAELPPAVVRAKGIVRLVEAPDRRFVLQLVGRRWSLEEATDEPQENWPSTRSVVVCIGPAAQFDRARLEALFAPVAPSVVPPAIAALLHGEGRS
jgi:G3E family GTPase